MSETFSPERIAAYARIKEAVRALEEAGVDTSDDAFEHEGEEAFFNHPLRRALVVAFRDFKTHLSPEELAAEQALMDAEDAEAVLSEIWPR